jgi:hypothetical protein
MYLHRFISTFSLILNVNWRVRDLTYWKTYRLPKMVLWSQQQVVGIKTLSSISGLHATKMCSAFESIFWKTLNAIRIIATLTARTSSRHNVVLVALVRTWTSYEFCNYFMDYFNIFRLYPEMNGLCYYLLHFILELSNKRYEHSPLYIEQAS